jgi:TetR/AcrR family transcriptional regulator
MPFRAGQKKGKRTGGAAPETRAAILAAAEGMFAREGLAGARTDAIAKAAGVNKALLYYYFASKEQLYEAVVEEHFRLLTVESLKVFAPSPAGGPRTGDDCRRPRDILLQYIDVQFEFMRAHQQYASLYQHLMLAGAKATQKTAEKIVRKYFLPRAGALQELLRRGMREGDFREMDVVHAAVSITALVVFYFSASRVLVILGEPAPYSDASLRRRKEEVCAFIRHGLFLEKS